MAHQSFVTPNPSRILARLPLWAVLTIPFITLLVATISLTGYLALRNSQQVVRDIGEQLLDEITGRIEVHLASFLQTPHYINDSNANMMRLGVLDSTDQDAMQQYLWEQVQVYDSVTSIYFGNTEGGLVVGGREGADGSLYVMASHDFAAGPVGKYATDDAGEPIETLFEIPQFDARTRLWYEGALSRGGANWSPPYVLSTGQDLAIAASRPIYSESGDLLGVTSVDLFFSHVSNFLQELAIGQTGQAYIVEQSGLLVATSTDAATFRANGDDEWQRIAAVNSADPVIAATARHLVDQSGGFPADAQQIRMAINGEATYLRATPYRDPRGLNWVIVIAIPERDFLARIDDHNRVTLALTVLALLLAVVVGIVTVLQVLRPIMGLNTAAAALAQSDWSQQVPVSGPREIRQLGQTFNAMASQLRDLFTHLEERVQERTQAVIASEARYRAIVEDQTEFICRFAPDNTLTFVNGAYCRYFNKTYHDLMGYNFMSHVPKVDQPLLAERLATLSSDNPVVTAEHRVIKPAGNGQGEQLCWMQWVNRGLYDESGAMIEIQAVGRDITEQKRLALALQKALDHEMELNELKTHFVSTVSHEFRTPLSVILNASEVLERYLDKLEPDKREELFRRIETQINRMTALLDDVFAINQAQRGRSAFAPAIIDLVPLCRAAIQEVRTANGTDVIFTFTPEEDACIEIEADAGLLRLIVVNLISNAAKYSQPGGTVTVDLTCTDEHSVLTVQDEGIGIPEDAQSQVFTPFYRAENVGTRPGTGLGLALAKQSVDQHGGTISFVSEEGKGTTFTVILPNIAFLETQHAEDFGH